MASSLKVVGQGTQPRVRWYLPYKSVWSGDPPRVRATLCLCVNIIKHEDTKAQRKITILQNHSINSLPWKWAAVFHA